MPRRARLMLPDVAVHVIQRGNNRAACFVSDEDRRFYLFHLSRMLPKTGCLLHAFCLMTNHVHLLLTTAEVKGCGLLMKSIGELYARYFNKSHKRSGYLWEGRYKSCLVQAEDYVLACYRYVDLNPVRGGLVRRADEYPWSSYRFNAIGDASGLLSPHGEYLRLGNTPAERQAMYRELIAEVQGQETLQQIRNAANGGYVLGSAAFRSAMARALGRRVDRASAGRPVRQPVASEQSDLLLGE
jgi:putative transposase